jgi:lipid A 3-O-deacylase
MHFVPAVACGLLALSLQAAAAPAADAGPSAPAPNPWVIGSAGTFALVEQFGYPWLVGLQYRSTPRTSLALMPGVGVAGGPDGMGFLYADVARDFPLSGHWTMTLSFAAGYFLNGDAIGVNEHLEFQSGIALARQLSNGVRLGLAGYHVSNGGLAHPNNGTEALALWVAVPVRTGRWRARSGPGPAQGLYRGVSGATPLPGAGSCARYAESARLSSVE